MRVLRFDRQVGELKAAVETIEDLWFLKKLISEGDVIIATSFRRHKSEDKLRPDSGEKMLVHLDLKIESVELAESVNKLRITGKILSGSPEEYVQKGAHHTIDLELRSTFKLRKQFLPYHIRLIEDAKKKAASLKALIVVMDEQKALLASLRNNGLKFLFEIESDASKRDAESFKKKKDAFFKELLLAILQENSPRTLIASPGFSKDDFRKYVEDQDPSLGKTLLFDHVSSAEKTAVYELLKKGALERLISEQKVEKEFEALEKLKASLGREDGLSCYGIDEVRTAVEMKAAEVLLIEDELLRKDRVLNAVMEKAEHSGAKIVIFNSEDDAGREFSAFKIAALLRYRIK